MDKEEVFPMRLQAYMAKAGVASRRSSESLILQGRVMVNNKKVLELGTKVKEDDVVQVDGETIEIETKKYYIALNKPRDYVCTNYDPKETMYARDLIKIKDSNLLYSVGRLDKDSNGLILFTNDGNFSNRILHPKYEIEKEYLVKLDRAIEYDDLREALEGIYLDDSKTPYRIKSYRRLPNTRVYLSIILTEGKNREIRKMFDYLGYRVKSLTRIRIGNVELGDLKIGDWRNLTLGEVRGLMELSEGKE